MNNTFGPIYSRRFGLSLGIDLSPDAKSCNFNCVYCELEKAPPTDTISNPPKVIDIVKNVKKALQKHPNIDVITITSNGEPTLYKDLDLLVDELNKIKNNTKLLILSNGATITNPSIQSSLNKIDIVKLSLDAITHELFLKIDKPLKGINTTDIVNAMIKFQKSFKNELVIEILIVKNINDTKQEMLKLNEALKQIKPHRVDIGTIDRPPAFSNTKPLTEKELDKLSNTFDPNIPICIIKKELPKDMKLNFSKEELITMIKRRPQSILDVKAIFSEQSKSNLKTLIQKRQITPTKIANIEFYKIR